MQFSWVQALLLVDCAAKTTEELGEIQKMWAADEVRERWSKSHHHKDVQEMRYNCCIPYFMHHKDGRSTFPGFRGKEVNSFSQMKVMWHPQILPGDFRSTACFPPLIYWDTDFSFLSTCPHHQKYQYLLLRSLTSQQNHLTWIVQSCNDAVIHAQGGLTK